MFYLTTHFIYGYMVSDILDSKSEIYCHLFSSKGSLLCTMLQTPQPLLHQQCSERAQWVHHDGSIRRPIAR